MHDFGEHISEGRTEVFTVMEAWFPALHGSRPGHADLLPRNGASAACDAFGVQK
ncbi:hypothetical protein [Streptomyces sp. 150FB]|uniref:hypothetical protein n=1 Tax=Streptomyces sp. 150FB TaxID=1576605 RepID=UPI001364BE9C|nr:hypothetical protein [Streptomyces sp. 150FB]